jgi:Ribonuclease HepT-like
MRIHATDALAIASRIGRNAFLGDRPMQHAVIRCLTVIGEAANRVSEETALELPEVAWSEAIGLRDVFSFTTTGASTWPGSGRSSRRIYRPLSPRSISTSPRSSESLIVSRSPTRPIPSTRNPV